MQLKGFEARNPHQRASTEAPRTGHSAQKQLRRSGTGAHGSSLDRKRGQSLKDGPFLPRGLGWTHLPVNFLVSSVNAHQIAVYLRATGPGGEAPLGVSGPVSCPEQGQLQGQLLGGLPARSAGNAPARARAPCLSCPGFQSRGRHLSLQKRPGYRCDSTHLLQERRLPPWREHAKRFCGAPAQNPASEQIPTTGEMRSLPAPQDFLVSLGRYVLLPQTPSGPGQCEGGDRALSPPCQGNAGRQEKPRLRHGGQRRRDRLELRPCSRGGVSRLPTEEPAPAS